MILKNRPQLGGASWMLSKKGRYRCARAGISCWFLHLPLSVYLSMLLALLYFASLSLFFLHDNGTWFIPSFGGRGWFSFLRSIPWFLVLLIIVFVGLLEVLVRRYAFVYRKPLLLSAAGIVVLVIFGGFLIAATPFHRQMKFYANHNQLPPPLAFIYGAPFRMPPPPDVYHGTFWRRQPRIYHQRPKRRRNDDDCP